ncbi:MAG: AarF/ABC1/UbiB kinase family protein [Bdellovibrionota bacterium]
MPIKLFLKAASASPRSLPKSLLIESSRISSAWFKHAVVGLPLNIGRSFISSSRLEHLAYKEQFKDLISDSILNLFDDLGPVYGKMGQIYLSRLPNNAQEIAESFHITRLYGDWPPLPFEQVEKILDDEIPTWREQFTIDVHPLGVASMAQVHAAMDLQGRKWAIKILKPRAKIRLLETVSLIEKFIKIIQPIKLSKASQLVTRDLKELCKGFRKEASLDNERRTIKRVYEKMKKRPQKLISIPKTYDEFCTDNVLAIEFFEGTSLEKIVTGKVELPIAAKKKLAKTLLHELLVQVFEMGLFHGDPHAGNLILLEDMSIGLFDWGLTGELLESDRKHIAAILKAVIAMDMDRLVEAIYTLGKENANIKREKSVSRAAIRKELKKFSTKLSTNTKNGSKPSLCDLIETCLKSTSKLGIEMPQGLLLMAKSLVTIEGLAKGIDPEVPIKRIATPVLFKAARPGISDFLMLGKNLPKLVKRLKTDATKS